MLPNAITDVEKRWVRRLVRAGYTAPMIASAISRTDKSVRNIVKECELAFSIMPHTARPVMSDEMFEQVQRECIASRGKSVEAAQGATSENGWQKLARSRTAIRARMAQETKRGILMNELGVQVRIGSRFCPTSQNPIKVVDPDTDRAIREAVAAGKVRRFGPGSGDEMGGW